MSEHHRLLEKAYLAARCNAYYAPRIRVEDGEAAITLPIRADFHHGMGAAHDSVVFKALDDAAFFAANSRVKDVWVLTSSFHVQFLAPIVDGELRAVGRVVHQTQRQVLADAEARDAEGRLIARGTGTFAHSRVPAPAAPRSLPDAPG